MNFKLPKNRRSRHFLLASKYKRLYRLLSVFNPLHFRGYLWVEAHAIPFRFTLQQLDGFMGL